MLFSNNRGGKDQTRNLLPLCQTFSYIQLSQWPKGPKKAPKYLSNKRTHRSFCGYLSFTHYSNLETYQSYYHFGYFFYLPSKLSNDFLAWYNMTAFVLHKNLIMMTVTLVYFIFFLYHFLCKLNGQLSLWLLPVNWVQSDSVKWYQ